MNPNSSARSLRAQRSSSCVAVWNRKVPEIQSRDVGVQPPNIALARGRSLGLAPAFGVGRGLGAPEEGFAVRVSI